jgi:hypothetical protein
MDFAKAIAIFVTGVFSSAMTNAFVNVAPRLKSGIDIVLIRVDERPSAHRCLDNRFDGLLLNIREHLEHHFSPALNHAEDRGLLFFERTASPKPFELGAAALCGLFFYRLRLTFVACGDVDLIKLNRPR